MSQPKSYLMWNRYVDVMCELTTYCNAKCPQCSRTNKDGLDKRDYVVLKHVDLQEWINTYEKSYRFIKSFHFSGQWGDVMMNPHVEDIFKHIVNHSSAMISFSTNGSLRDEEFFWRIGSLTNNIIGVFDIDGFTQETHEHYRRNTDLKKVMNNCETFAMTNSKTEVFTVVFKHNQHEIDMISDWCKERGIVHKPFQSNRFVEDSSYKYMWKDKEYILEQTTDKRFLDTYEMDGRTVRDWRK